jgi:predicted RNA-binding Zn-ribbon protein involved in translation (DUF1610 family)
MFAQSVAATSDSVKTNGTIAVTRSAGESFFPPFCVECGDRLPDLPARAIACPSCGGDLVPHAALVRRKERRAGTPWIAALLGLVPGAGQVYNGQFLKGFFVLATCFLVVPWIFGIIDAYRTAKAAA